jgi:putative transposase
MARLPRLVVPSQPHYVIQRGLNGLPVFQDTDDCTTFLAFLRSAARTYKVAIHAYVLLPGQLHLLATPSDEDGLGGMMQWLGRCYVPYYNQKYGRSGTLWHGRYKTSVVDAANFLLTCSRYMEYSPVREGLAAEPADYAWSSYPHHAGMRTDPVVTDHSTYWSLGNTPFQREAAYIDLASQDLTAAQIAVVEAAVLTGWPLGSDAFKKDLEQKARRQVLPAKRGRPFKQSSPT